MVGVARVYGTDFQKHIQYILFVFFWKFDHHAQCLTFEGSQLGYYFYIDGQLIFQHKAFSLVSFGMLS